VKKTSSRVSSHAHSLRRIRNVFLRHGLIGSSNHDSLGFPVIEENLHKVTDFCVGINTTDFDKGVDCNAKLSDLAMTALALIKLFKQNMSPFNPLE
jgi:hypothetical protein